MDKFTKVVKVQDKAQVSEEKEIVYEGDYMSIKNVNGWEYVIESDRIVVLPYFKDEGYVFLRSENIPPWSDKYKGNKFGKSKPAPPGVGITTQFLTVISGTIEDGETPEQTLRRELYEEAGIAMTQFFNFDIEGPYFESKGSVAQFYVCLMELSYTDFKMVAPPGDGTQAEKVAKTLRVSIADLEEIKINDMATRLLVDKLKNNYNL